MLLDDDVGTEAAFISYPTSREALGRGINLMQSGTTVFVIPITFRRRNIFMPSFCSTLQACCLLFSTKIWFCNLMYLISAGQRHSFTFDRVFNHGASQQDVFVEISELVQSAVDGYKVNLLSSFQF